MAFGSVVCVITALVGTGISVFCLSEPLLERLLVRQSFRKPETLSPKSSQMYAWPTSALRRLGLMKVAESVEQASPEHRRKEERIRDQLPGAIEAIGSSLAAGQSVQQSIAYVAGNVEDPLGSELRAVVWDLDAGRSLDYALGGLEQRLPMREIAFLRLAFRVQERTGGSMREVLESACASLRDAADFERTLRSSTAQARLSAKVVGITPIILLGFVSLMSPGYIGVFFSSVSGFAMLVAAIMLDVVGVTWIRRITNVR